MKSKSSIHVNVGGASILVIFVVLCLAIFGMLSVVSANAELRLSRKTATAVAEYYIADKIANQTLEQMDTIVSDTLKKGENSISAISTALSAKMPQLTIATDSTGNACTVAFETKINKQQYLSATIHIPLNGNPYTISQWKVQRNDTLVYEDQEIELFDPNALLESME